MRWYSVKKYSPAGAVTDCMVRTKGGGLWMACNETYDKDTFKFVCNRTDEYIEDVTHFCIPEPVEIEE